MGSSDFLRIHHGWPGLPVATPSKINRGDVALKIYKNTLLNTRQLAGGMKRGSPKAKGFL